jgi:hypothetical protein
MDSSGSICEKWRASEHGYAISGSIKGREFVELLSDY